eukprot:Gb_13036 [translate_table: standard]
MRTQDLLMEQNVALDLSRREAQMAIHTRNDFLPMINHEMCTPMHAIIALCTLIQASELTPEQQSMVETIIACILKSSNLLATLINDVLDLSGLKDGSLELDTCVFNLSRVFREVLNVVKPIESVKKLSISMSLSSDLPESIDRDDEHLLQIALIVIRNAIKFPKEGCVSVYVLEKPEYLRDP